MLKKRCLLILATVLAMGPVAGTAGDNPPRDTAEKILASVEAQKGFRPPALELMAERTGMLERFMPFGRAAFEGGPLTEREAYLVAVAAAVALKSPPCIQAHAHSALRAGASWEDIHQVMMIAGVVSGTSPLHVARQAFQE